MQPDQMVNFGPYRLDLASARLWRGKQEVRMTGKAFAVLRHLVTHAGELVTKDQLFQSVWPETVVSDAALTSCIKELRRLLRDQAQERRYLETVHRRGFRFIGQLRDLQDRTRTPTETAPRQRADGMKDIERKLAAILSADVQGYSRLMGADEVGTIRTLTGYRAVTDSCILQHRGRMVNTAGDSVLAEFASAVDAVQCAVEIQQALAAKNTDLPPGRKMAFRIGLNVGDVVVEGEQLYGDGVNIAARLEGLAEAGGLCISGTVYDQIKNKLALVYEDLGPQTLKNIAEPVRVYRVKWEPERCSVHSTATPAQQGLPKLRPTARPSGVRRRQPPKTSARVLGREAELTQLSEYWEKALRGERQMVFVTGEPGIGKTTLVEAFLQQVVAEGGLWWGRGQCIEHYGTGEAYLPLFEALGRLGRESEGQRLIDLLSQHAPTWLVQMPALLTATELEMLQRKTHGATRERMLRELAEALETLAAERPFVLWLEDLHWCDVSTLDWLAYVARQREPARLLVVGTYRPVDVLVREHPLGAMKQELQTHGYCTELLLDFLSEEEVREYLAVRFVSPAPFQRGDPGEGLPPASLQRLARIIHRRTDGNPLFMINVVDSLVARGVLVQSDGRWELKGGVKEVEEGVPESLRQLIEQQIERVRPETQRMLEVASIAGAEFSAAAVAAGMETEVDVIEEQCEGLVRREQFLRAGGTIDWPDGTVAARYGFLHALYQDVLYHRLTARRRQRLHQRIGEREEAAYGDRAGEIAAELAMHFEQGRDYRRAVQYLQQAGMNALQRSAHREALNLFTQGLELLKALPDTSERAQQELTLQVILGRSLTATRGWAAPEVERAFARAQELCQQIGETPQLFLVLQGLCSYHLARGKLHAARELAEQLRRLAQNMSSQDYLLRACTLLGQTLYFLGEFASAREHLEQGIALSGAQKHRLYIPPDTLQHFGVVCFCYVALALCALGYPDQALRRIHEALTLARDLDHPLSLAFALHHGTLLYGWRREWSAVHAQAEATITVATERGFSYLLALGVFDRGWALVEQGHYEEGLAQMRQGVADSRATGGAPVWFHGLLAEASGKVERPEEGLSILAKALVAVDKSGTRHYEAELYRIKGQLVLQSGVQSPKSDFTDSRPLTLNPQAEAEAEACFLKALEIARHQQAKLLELRAVMSLSRLWQRQGKKREARQILAEIYGWFTEGFDTKDLQEAKALLEELEGKGRDAPTAASTGETVKRRTNADS